MSNMTRVRLVTDVVRGTTTFRAGTICDVVPGRVDDDGPKLLVSVDGQLVALTANQYEKISEADTIGARADDWTREPITADEAAAGIRMLEFTGPHDLSLKELKSFVGLLGKLEALVERGS